MNTYTEIMMKLAEGKTLDPIERELLREYTQEIDNNRQIVSSWQSIDNRIAQKFLNLPLETIYSKVLEQNMASITIYPDASYKNIIILGSGSITNANGGNIWAQFNGDTGSNYMWQFIKGAGATISGGEDTSDPYVALGVFGTTGAGAGVNGSFRAEIIHCNGAWKKNVLSHTYTAEFNDLYILGSTWQNTAPISQIEIFGTDNTLAKGTTNLASGSLFTVYGMK